MWMDLKSHMIHNRMFDERQLFYFAEIRGSVSAEVCSTANISLDIDFDLPKRIQLLCVEAIEATREFALN
jgi:hypothetical protein